MAGQHYRRIWICPCKYLLGTLVFNVRIMLTNGYNGRLRRKPGTQPRSSEYDVFDYDPQ